MTGIPSHIGQMIAQRRLVAARRELDKLKASGAVIEGLDQALRRIDARLAQAVQHVAAAKAWAKSGDDAGARGAMEQARQLVADLDAAAPAAPLAPAVPPAPAAPPPPAEDDNILGRLHVESRPHTGFGRPGLSPAAPSAPATPSRWRKPLQIVGWAAVAVTIIGGVVTAGVLYQRGVAERLDRVRHRVTVTLEEAEEHLRHERFADARDCLTEVLTPDEPLLPPADPLTERAQAMMKSDAMVHGLNGEVELDGQWMTREQREKHKRDLEQIDSRLTGLRDGLGNLLGSVTGVPVVQELTLAGDLAVLDADAEKGITLARAAKLEAIKVYVDVIDRARNLLGRIDMVLTLDRDVARVMPREDAEAKQMQALGMVKYKDQWMTPAEMIKRQEQARQGSAAAGARTPDTAAARSMPSPAPPRTSSKSSPGVATRPTSPTVTPRSIGGPAPMDLANMPAMLSAQRYVRAATKPGIPMFGSLADRRLKVTTQAGGVVVVEGYCKVMGHGPPQEKKYTVTMKSNATTRQLDLVGEVKIE